MFYLKNDALGTMTYHVTFQHTVANETACILEIEDKERNIDKRRVATEFVTRYHRDTNDRRIAREESFKKVMTFLLKDEFNKELVSSLRTKYYSIARIAR